MGFMNHLMFFHSHYECMGMCDLGNIVNCNGQCTRNKLQLLSIDEFKQPKSVVGFGEFFTFFRIIAEVA